MSDTDQNKKIVIVTSSSSYEPRTKRIGTCFQNQGYEVRWIETDFIHREKKKRTDKNVAHLYVNTIPYKRNLSIKRLYSQYDFAKKAGKLMEAEKADLYYVLLPANSLAAAAVKAKEKNHARLVFDIIDLWPESLGFSQMGKLSPLQFWKRMRDNYLGKADLIITECAYYQKVIKKDLSGAVTMYWPKEQPAQCVAFQPDGELLHLAYLGSINNIIDISLIIKILTKMNAYRAVKLHIIGDGEKREIFLSQLEKAGIMTEYHGVIYEEDKKKEIFEKCTFGINIMKKGVCVGLTMKSVDYFCYGLPLINNIPGDTWELVDKYKIGVNSSLETLDSDVSRLLDEIEEFQKKRTLIQKLYEEYFTVSAMEKTLKQNVLPLMNQGGK